MEICVFYSWQSVYRDTCDKIIRKAIDGALEELNNEYPEYSYILERGGGDVLGAEHIDNNIDKIIKHKADIAIVDFTHIGNIPIPDPRTNEWIKERCNPNTNVVYENGKLEYALGDRQVLKVYNTAYGDLNVNLEMPFDLRQQHHPIPFFCNETTDKEERTKVVNKLKSDIKKLLIECTKDLLLHQKVRYAPLVPLYNEFEKNFWKGNFCKTKLYKKVYDKIIEGRSFRLIGLPGLGKTRMVGEAFRGREIDVYYCDCREQANNIVEQAIVNLLEHRVDRKQTVILDNCSQKLCGCVTNTICEFGYNCQLITVYYDPKEDVDSGIEEILVKVEDTTGVVDAMLGSLENISKEDKELIVDMAGGFPLMAKMMIENYQKGESIINIRKKDVFERMLGIDSQKTSDKDILRVLTAFSIFKFIGLYGQQEKQGRFIAGNRIVTGISGSEDDIFHLFKEVFCQYSKMEILEREGNLVLMRLIPLAVYLCKSWFDKQSPETIGDLIEQIRTHQDEGVRNMLIESLSRRITLLSEIPLAKDLADGLTDPDKSPFLSEEVVLSALGSRLFLAFSEVNPEACACAIKKILEDKIDDEIKKIEPARRNLAWALDHLAFDSRSFKNAMMTLARLSLVETENWISNNTTGLFVNRFPIILAGTEANLESRIEVIKELSIDFRYRGLIKKSLHRALGIGHFYRSGGAEKQGIKRLEDYYPSHSEITSYIGNCFNMLIQLVESKQDIDDIANTIVQNARGYYISDMDDFLLNSIEVVATLKNYVWEDMKDTLIYLIKYDIPKRKYLKRDEFVSWLDKLTSDDYVYRLLHVRSESKINYLDSFEQEQRKIKERYKELAKEFIDKGLYKDDSLLDSILKGECFYYNCYGAALSEYSCIAGNQELILDKILNKVLNGDVSNDAEVLLIFFLLNVSDHKLLDDVYSEVFKSDKKRLLPAMYAIKCEGRSKEEQLFVMLNKRELYIDDFSGYFRYSLGSPSDMKYVVSNLLNYGGDGAQIVLKYCNGFLFSDKVLDKEYETIAKRCLMQLDLKGIQIDDYIFLHSVKSYLMRYYDEDLALHIHKIQALAFEDVNFKDSYYIGRLYKFVLQRYTNLLKPILFELLENKKVCYKWIELLRTSYPQEGNADEPIYTLISSVDWFEWIKGDANSYRVYTLALILSYAEAGRVNSDMLKLIDGYWCDKVKDAISARMHSYSWTGSGIPLYKARIALCEEYVAKLTNKEAKDWFKQDINYWKQEIERERLQNAHERALYS